jgi:hypothetical protein
MSGISATHHYEAYSYKVGAQGITAAKHDTPALFACAIYFDKAWGLS